MIIKWTRESLLVLLTLIMVLIALLYYGNRLIIDPVKVTADTSSQVVNEQDILLNTYPPAEDLRQELEEEYTDTTQFIPSGERINEAVVLIQQIAESNDVNLTQMSRLDDNQTVEGLAENFLKSTYQIELESASAANLRNMLDQLNEQDRLWNSQVFSYQRESEDVITGSLIIDLYYHVTLNN